LWQGEDDQAKRFRCALCTACTCSSSANQAQTRHLLRRQLRSQRFQQCGNVSVSVSLLYRVSIICAGSNTG
jgi:hypothetical protein